MGLAEPFRWMLKVSAVTQLLLFSPLPWSKLGSCSFIRWLSRQCVSQPSGMHQWPGPGSPFRPTPLHFWALLPSLHWHPVSMGASLFKWRWGAENTSSRSSSLRHPLHVIPPALTVRLSLDRCGRSGLLNRNGNHIKMTMTGVGTWGTHNGGPYP